MAQRGRGCVRDAISRGASGGVPLGRRAVQKKVEGSGDGVVAPVSRPTETV